ncbi:MAG: hypothetical protein EOO01_42695 [Chitinophagaceae bacterium]|nr:MAG: hypothetical protein EOO01_42695 [Chitinophagaceae bacterium]
MRTYQDYVTNFREEAQYLMGQQVSELKLKCLYNAVPTNKVCDEFQLHLDMLEQQLEQSIDYIIKQAKKEKDEANLLKSELYGWYKEYRDSFIKRLRSN